MSVLHTIVSADSPEILHYLYSYHADAGKVLWQQNGLGVFSLVI